jgi:hypothetical protein
MDEDDNDFLDDDLYFEEIECEYCGKANGIHLLKCPNNKSPYNDLLIYGYD